MTDAMTDAMTDELPPIPTLDSLYASSAVSEMLAMHKVMSVAMLAYEPLRPREWLLAPWIPLGTTTLLYGDGGTGKSLLAQQLLTCVNAGVPFMGLPTLHDASMGLFCEDDLSELHRRQHAINQYYGVDYERFAHYYWLASQADNALVRCRESRAPEVTDNFYELRRRAVGLKAKLLVIDTAADVFDGNENIRSQVHFFIHTLNMLAREMNGAVLLLAHPSVYGLTSGTGTGGSTAWSNTVRSRLYLKPVNGEGGDPNLRVLTRYKANYAGLDEQGIELRWQDGVFVPAKDSAHANEAHNLTQCMRDFIAAMHKLKGEGRRVSANKYSGNYVVRIVQQKYAQHSLKQLEQVMNILLDEGYIMNIPYGAPSKALSHLVVVKALE